MADYSKQLFEMFSAPGEAVQEKRNYAAQLQQMAEGTRRYEESAARQMFNDQYNRERDVVKDKQWADELTANRTYRDSMLGIQQSNAERLGRPNVETFYTEDGRETKGIYDESAPGGFRPVGGAKTNTANIPNGYQPRPDGGGLTFTPGGPADPAVIANLAGVRGGDGGGPKPLPAEIGARIGLGNQFINVDLPSIRQEITKGTLGGKGLLNNAEAMFNMSGGFGKAGEINRRIQTGLDALRRNLTGQGMSASEAQDYVNRYVPGVADSVKTINSKLDGLESDLNATAAGATAGRQAPPSMMPTAPGGAPSYQRQDIEAEMRRRGIM
jgi:hypothetical protein